MIRAAFFDLGNTLVFGDRDWVPGAREILSELQNRGVILGLISNTGNLTREEVLQLLPEDFDLNLFAPDLVLLSSEIGIEKPSLTIFLEAVKRAGISPTDTLFCTENLHHTIVAQLAGMRTIRLLPPEQTDIGNLVAILEEIQQF